MATTSSEGEATIIATVPSTSTDFAIEEYATICAKRDGQIHIGRDVWLPKARYEAVLRAAGTNKPQRYVKELAAAVYGYPVLMIRMLIGRKNPHNNTEGVKPSLDKKKMDAITGMVPAKSCHVTGNAALGVILLHTCRVIAMNADSFIAWLRATGTSGFMIPKMAKHVPKYVCKKIQDILKLKKRKEQANNRNPEDNNVNEGLMYGGANVNEGDMNEGLNGNEGRLNGGGNGIGGGLNVLIDIGENIVEHRDEMNAGDMNAVIEGNNIVAS